MKQLSIEEKAKCYDEVLRNARMFYKDEHVSDDVNNLLEALFPELKEGEDERIRKEICKLLWDNAPYEEAQEYIAWLEKQGERQLDDTDIKFIRMRETKPKDICEFLDRLTTVEQEFFWEHIEKVKKVDRENREQKPADTNTK